VQREARVVQQPPAHRRGLAGGEVVADHVDFQARLDRLVDLVEEVAEVDGRVPRRVRYRPATSRIFGTRRGSGETLNVSVRHGCRPKARQICCTLVAEMPVLRASSRLDQCVEPSDTSSRCGPRRPRPARR
jgi:hypothetical protein